MEIKKQLARLLKSKWYLEKGVFTIRPRFTTYWRGDIWVLSWFTHSITIDMRVNWLLDMVTFEKRDR